MLQKASKEGIVVEQTNLYDHFFSRKRERKAKVTAARLPYFDGDYWPGAAEDMLNKICLPEGDRNVKKNRKIKSTITKRDSKAAGVTDLCGSASKDAMLMQKLGELIYPMKEDFIMVHLQYSCSHCCILMVSGRRWKCNQCESFYICDKLTKHSAGADRDVQNIRQECVQTARAMLGLLTHAVACGVLDCQHPNCRKIKVLYHDGTKCQQRVLGGCPLCKKLWGIIHFHARACKESQCRVPRCRDLKEHMRRLQQQSESRRRAAVNEMMTQRAAEVKQ